MRSIAYFYMKRAVIFDFGGVLVKTLDYRPRHTWDERLNLPHGSVEKIVHGSYIWRNVLLGRVSLDDYWAEIARQLRLDDEAVQQLAHDYYSGDRLDDDLIAYIRELREHGHTVALLSNATTALEEELRVLQIADLFDPTIISAYIGAIKPDPAAYQAALAALHRPADETIFIDDMPDNIAAAQALGIQGIRYVADMDLRAALEPLLTRLDKIDSR